MKQVRTAVIIQTHFINDYIENFFKRLSSSVPEGHDVFILCNYSSELPVLSPMADDLYRKNAIVLVNTSKILSLGFPAKCHPDGWTGKGWSLIPGNCDLNLLQFLVEKPDYDFFWSIEYDVHFEGNWKFFFDRFKESLADLIGTTIYRASDIKPKILNPPLKGPDGALFDLKKTVIGFYPIYRMSRNGLQLLADEYSKGWDGHYEITLGTILDIHGMQIEDIGGNGCFVRAENTNAFYFNSPKTYSLSPGNFVFRPIFSKPLRKENTLWHPVKPEGSYFRHDPSPVKQNSPQIVFARVKQAILNIALHLWFLTVWRQQP